MFSTEVFKLTFSIETDASNPPDFAYSTMKTYVFVHEKKTWDDARNACKIRGGDLATFPSNEEFDSAITKETRDYAKNAGSGDYRGFWIGGIREPGEDYKNTWKWLSGEPLPHDNKKWYTSGDYREPDLAVNTKLYFYQDENSSGFRTFKPNILFPFLCRVIRKNN